MRILSLIATLLVFASCASHQSDDRAPASAESACKIEKHHKNDWYRLTVNGEPAFKSWYTKSQVDAHFSSYMKNGKCN